MAYDIEGARKAGGSEEVIANYLSGKYGYDLKGALASGGDYKTINNYLAAKEDTVSPVQQQAPAPEMEDTSYSKTFSSNFERTMREGGQVFGIGSDEKFKASVAQSNKLSSVNPLTGMAGQFAGLAVPLVAGAFATPEIVGASAVAGALRLAPGLSKMVQGLISGTAKGAIGGVAAQTVKMQGDRESMIQGGTPPDQADDAVYRQFLPGAAGMALPVGMPGKLGMRVASGAGVNVAAGMAERVAGNTALDPEYKQDLLSVQGTGLEAALGAGMSAVFGGRAPLGATVKPSTTGGGGPSTGELNFSTRMRASLTRAEEQLNYHTEKAQESNQKREKLRQELDSGNLRPEARAVKEAMIAREEETFTNLNEKITDLNKETVNLKRELGLVEDGEAASLQEASDSTKTGKPQEKMITIYRGEGPDNIKDGTWWTTNREKAARFGTVREVTLPESEVAKHAAQGHGGADELVFLDTNPEVLAAKALAKEPPIKRVKGYLKDAQVEADRQARSNAAASTVTADKTIVYDKVDSVNRQVHAKYDEFAQDAIDYPETFLAVKRSNLERAAKYAAENPNGGNKGVQTLLDHMSDEANMFHQIAVKRLQQIDAELKRTDDIVDQGNLTKQKKMFEDAIGQEEVIRLGAITKHETHLSTVVDPKLEGVLRKSGVEGALRHIIDNYPHDSNSIIAKFLLDNPLLRPFMNTELLGRGQGEGQYNSVTRAMRFSQEGMSVAEVFLHEVGHNASFRIFRVVDHVLNGGKDAATLREFNSLTSKQRESAIGIRSLHSFILKTHPEFLELHPMAMSSADEFFSYGLTNPSFKALLMSVKGTGIDSFSSALKQMFKYFANILGFDGNLHMKSAMAELFMHGKTLIKYSKGEAVTMRELKAWQSPKTVEANLRQRVRQQAPTAVDLRIESIDELKARSTSEGWRDTTGSYFSKFFENWFGKQQYENLTNAPLVKYVLNNIYKGDVAEQKLMNYALYGNTGNLPRWQKGPLIDLGKIESGEALPFITKNLKDSDAIAVWKVITHAGENKISHTDMREKHTAHLTPFQKKLYKALTDSTDRVRKFANAEMHGGLKELGVWADRDGFNPAIHKGDYELIISFKDTVLHAEKVRTRAELNHLMNRVKNDPNWKGSKVSSRDLIAERFEEGTGVKNEEQLIAGIDKLYTNGTMTKTAADAMKERLLKNLASNGTLGGHHKYRKDISGYQGKRLYKTDAQNAMDMIKAYVEYPAEIGSLMRKKIAARESDAALSDPHFIENFPNQVATGKHLLNMYKGDYLPPKMDKYIRNFVDDVVITSFNKARKLAGKEAWFPESHILDRTHGAAAHLFYMNALTSRPGFWVAQSLTSVQAIRMMFREQSAIDGMIHTGKGMQNVFSGGDAAFHEAVLWVARHTNSFHPQFVNELNYIGFKLNERLGGKAYSEFLRGVIPWATGEKFSASADAASRYMSFAMFYEKYKAKGYKGEDLYLAAARDTDSTMIMYNNPNRAPIIREMGLLGDMVAPLQTFATGQLGNLLSDVKYLADTRTLASTMPLVMTAATTVMFAGAIGLPFVAEYEALRQLAIFSGMKPESMPSFLDWLNQEEQMDSKVGGVQVAPRGALGYGLPSAATGIDIGSGMRWNQMITKVVTEGRTLFDLFPAIAFGKDMITNLIVLSKGQFPDDMVRQAEYRQAVMKSASFLIGSKGLIDEIGFDAGGRDFVPGGGRGYAMRPETTKERISTFVGSSTLEAKQDFTVQGIDMKQKEYRRSKIQNHIDVAMDGLLSGDGERVQRAVDKLLELEVDPKSINSQLEAAAIKRNIPLRGRLVDSTGKFRSDTAARNYRNLERFGDPL